jgi:hypothetical protein
MIYVNKTVETNNLRVWFGDIGAAGTGVGEKGGRGNDILLGRVGSRQL